VEEKLAKEISQGRIAGPFHDLPFVNTVFKRCAKACEISLRSTFKREIGR
jgi:hypothetical protein